MAADVLVRIEGLEKRFQPTAPPALAGIDATIRAGCMTGLVGPDGAGKTTLIRLIAGLLLPSAGRVTVDGLDSVRDAGAIHQRIGYMPQRFGLYEDLSVAENLRLYADLRGLVGRERQETFERLLRFTDLAAFTGRQAGRLSGGMKQKLGLACALLRTPRVLLLDEPSVGVDPISRRELWRMVGELSGEGIAVVWSTAYLDEAERCQEVLLLSEGKALYAGPPGELTARVAGRTLRVLGAGKERRQVLARALAQDGVRDGVIQGSNLRLVLARGASPPGGEQIGAPGARIEPTEPRFEDAFVDALGGGPGGRSALAERIGVRQVDGTAVIEAESLSKHFGDFVATDRVSFRIRQGEIFGLLGPNGAGKSTTFKMLCGLLRPSSGRARVTGLDLQHAASAARAQIGYMAQKFSLYGNLSAAQNLKFFASAYGLKGKAHRAAIAEMAAIFGLAPYLSQNAGELPLGFKQRLALACAVMHEPAVLFLDEPTSGVDPLTRREFWTHINGLVEKGVTIMVTTHFMDEAEYCDRIAIVYRGRVIASDSPDALKAQVASPALPDPTLEDAFIAWIQRSEGEREGAAA